MRTPSRSTEQNSCNTASQAVGRGFDPRLPLQTTNHPQPVADTPPEVSILSAASERGHGQTAVARPLPLFDAVAHARKDDPQTSKDAAARVKGISPLKQRILRVFRLAGWLTDEELIANYRKVYGEASLSSDQSIRSRRADLTKDGLIRDSGAVRPSKRGNDSTVWRLA